MAHGVRLAARPRARFRRERASLARGTVRADAVGSLPPSYTASPVERTTKIFSKRSSSNSRHTTFSSVTRKPALSTATVRRPGVGATRPTMKGAFKSFFGVPSGSSGGGSGTSGWEDFSTFSNTPPIASERRSVRSDAPPERLDEDVHPLTRDWADRINNRNVRAAFLQEPIDSYTTAHDLRVWTGTWNTNGKPLPGPRHHPVAGRLVPTGPGRRRFPGDRSAHPGQGPHAGRRQRDGRVGGHHRARPQRHRRRRGGEESRRRVGGDRLRRPGVRPRDVVSLVRVGFLRRRSSQRRRRGGSVGILQPPSASPPHPPLPPPRLRAVATVPLTFGWRASSSSACTSRCGPPSTPRLARATFA